MMNFRCNCLVLQSGERREATFGRNPADGTEASEGLSFHEMELAADTEDVFLVVDVSVSWLHGARHRHHRHYAEEVCRSIEIFIQP